MGTDRDEEPAIREVCLLMRMLTNLNAGAMLALCLWLAWAAMDFNAQQPLESTSIKVHGCGCVLNEITNWSGHINVASTNR
jgi:hypothetical protein